MSYLKNFTTLIASRDYSALVPLWDEYCMSDELDPTEAKEILLRLQASDLAGIMGRHVEKILTLWELLPDSCEKQDIFRLIVDLQTTNLESLRERVTSYLLAKYGDVENFTEKCKLVGLRSSSFQGSVRNFELLEHMKVGNFVFHKGGWGIGEILEVSPIREQIGVEFENVGGKKDLSFSNAFNILMPVPDDHFLAFRFGRPDELEQRAKQDSTEVIRMILRDLGPKNAAEIKNELYELVIPADDWNRWWQNARSKIKKDPQIEVIGDQGRLFRLRSEAFSHAEHLSSFLQSATDVELVIRTLHAFCRDFPDAIQQPALRSEILEKVNVLLAQPDLTEAQGVQLAFFRDECSGDGEDRSAATLLQKSTSPEATIDSIQVIALKKRALTVVRRERADWGGIFLSLLFKVEQNALRDYLFDELERSPLRPQLISQLETLITTPTRYPEVVVWYFHKVIQAEGLPLGDSQGRACLFEAFLTVLHYVEGLSTSRELVKKMYGLLTQGRYEFVRKVMRDASVTMVQEFLLLATKCRSLTQHDIKIMYSLAEVVYPSLGKKESAGDDEEAAVVWTTEQGLKKARDRIHEIATVEMVRNTQEIKVARSHGDLRENKEYHAALQQRDLLQGELEMLTQQVNRARVLTREDIRTDKVDVGSVVVCQSAQGKTCEYTLLGPWDADAERHILSMQSHLAQAMRGLAVGDHFQFQGEQLTIMNIKRYL